jgi:DNA-binding MarR family transcriptional regulator
MRAAWAMVLPPAQKFVLLALGDHACEFCGLCWPGIRSLGEKTGLGERSVTRALNELIAAGMVTIHRYPKGGRGRATEYLILPAHDVLPKGRERQAAPCAHCQMRMSFPP